MALDIRSLQKRYVDFCSTLGTLPNKAILSAFFKAQVKKAQHEVSSFVIFLDDLKSVDFHPLFDIFTKIEVSEIDAVDILQRSSCSMDGVYVLLLLHALNQKLRVVELQDRSFGKDFLLGLSQRGLSCQVLNLRSSHFQKLNMTGKFMHMHSMNLDFSASLSNFREDCFACMPNLKCLSLCETRITNLWTTIASLSKLLSLVELRFQSCLCCHNTGPCPKTELDNLDTASLDAYRSKNLYLNVEEDLMNVFPLDNYDVNHQSVSEASSDDMDLIHPWRVFNEVEHSDVLMGWNGITDSQNEVISLQSEKEAIAREEDGRNVNCYVNFFTGTWGMEDEEESAPSSSNSRQMSSFGLKKHLSYHPSPICYEKHYREYMIASLPNLKILDNLPIKKVDKDTARAVFSQHFEYLPYKRMNKESVVSILHNREVKSSHTRRGMLSHRPLRKSQGAYSRSLCAAKVGCSAWPLLRPLSVSGSIQQGSGFSDFRPRQFEYHPTNSSLMVIGSLDGEVVVVNHESEKLVAYIPSLGAMNSVLGLCWLKKYPSKLISGSDNGSLKLYDIQHMPSTSTNNYNSAGSVTFDEFDQLTSVHVNATDELFLASGYSKHVALYDIGTGNRLQVFTDMHQKHINVVKFANHNPSIFATSSFDHDVKMWDLRQKPIQPCYTASSGKGNVMVCFSPDDHYLLASAVDNEVKQLLAVDGRLHLDFGIPSTGSSQNYTRSYYMNGRDYIITGSCDEHLVRVCCAQTGRRLRDISLEGKGSGSSMFVQSLRGDPFRDFHMSILAAYLCPSSNPEIVKVNMLASNEFEKESSHNQRSWQPYSVGG